MLKISSIIFLSLFIGSAHARLSFIPAVYSEAKDSGTDDYRLGDEWGKLPVTPQTMRTESPAFIRAAKATAYLSSGGTGFYLGKFNDVHVLATNHHVCPTARDCEKGAASFRLLKRSFMMKKLLLTLPNVDLSLVEIVVPVEDARAMAKVARKFSFDKDLLKGQELLTIGFGVGGNENNEMMANQDSDCKVFSNTAEYVHLADPDEFNPADYKAWSFAHACDASHGDSGSAMVDRHNGDVVGLVWTGKTPKVEFVQSSANLIEMFNTSSPLIWTELSFAVPARKIGEHLRELLTDSQVQPDIKLILKDLLK